MTDPNVELVNPMVRRWQRDAAADPDAFWARAAEMLPWSRPWDRVFDWQPPTFKWFLGGETNLCANALDRHVAAGKAGAPRSWRWTSAAAVTSSPTPSCCTR